MKNWLSIFVLTTISSTTLASAFTQDDQNNLNIYTAQGYYINQDLRLQIPLSLAAEALDKTKSPTCAKLIEAKAPYLSEINVTPYKKFRPEDFKLYYLTQEALTKRGTPTPQRVYRGARSCNFLIDSQGKPVKFFLEKAFMSTSLREEVAQRFTTPMNDLTDASKNPKKQGCLMTIEGLSGVSIAEATGNYENEDEVLFPTGVIFEVTHFENGSQRRVTLKEVSSTAPQYQQIRTELLKNQFESQLNDIYSGTDRGQLDVDAENACREAYLFFTPNPEIRKKLKQTKPVYDLENKKLNPDDYIVEE